MCSENSLTLEEQLRSMEHREPSVLFTFHELKNFSFDFNLVVYVKL